MTDPASLAPRDIPNIDDWLPSTNADWPADLEEALSRFSQGTLIADPPFFYFADPRAPIWERTRAYEEGSDGPEVVEVDDETRPRFGVVTSQTCDVVEEDKDLRSYPWVQVAPVYDLASSLNSGLRRLVEQGKGPKHIVHIPDVPVDGFWCADLRISIPVEKGWLIRQAPVPGFFDDADRRRLGARISQLSSRPAFAKTIVENIQRPLTASLRALKDSNRPLHSKIDTESSELMISASDHLNPEAVQLMVVTDGDGLSDEVAEWWQTWWDSAKESCNSVGLNLLPFSVKHEDDIRLSDYRRMQALGIQRMSPE